MRNSHKLLIVSSLLILLLLTFFQNNQHYNGKISSINYYQKTTLINLENNSLEFILFQTTALNLQKNDNLKIYGKKETYKNKTQIIVTKIIKLT